MKRVLYAGGELLTDDAIATAVADYTAELARANTAEAIDVPGVFDDGSPHVTRLVLGPASQMFVEDCEAEGTIETEAFLADLAERRTALHAPAPSDGIMHFYDAL